MKKNFLIILLILFIVPFMFVNAECDKENCNGRIVYGGAVGSKSKYTENGAKCVDGGYYNWWGSNTDKGGVRVTIYLYPKDGKLNPEKLGAADIWTEEVYTKNFYMTSPSSSSDTLTNRKGANCLVKSESASKFVFQYKPKAGDLEKGWNDYIKNETVYQYTSKTYPTSSAKSPGRTLSEAWHNGEVQDWLYYKQVDKSGKTISKSGWLEENFFSKIEKGDNAGALGTFGIDEKNKNYASILEKFEDGITEDKIYVVAEIIHQSCNDGKVYSGTISEIAIVNQASCKGLFNKMFVDSNSISNVGYLTGVGSNNYIKEPDGEVSFGTYKDEETGQIKPYTCRGNSKNGTQQLCDKAYGMGIWWIKDCVCTGDDCPDPHTPTPTSTCDKECGSIPKGSSDRRSCAEKWCREHPDGEYGKCVETCTGKSTTPSKCNDKDQCGYYADGSTVRRVCAVSWCDGKEEKGSCIEDCSNIESPSCGSEYRDGSSGGSRICTTYEKSHGATTEASIGDVTCKSSIGVGEGGKFYTDDAELSTKTCYDVGVSSDILKYKYYKIDCTETLKLTELPTERNVLLSNVSKTGSLYVGYLMHTENKCDLYYAIDSKNWTKDYNASRLKNDMDRVGDIANAKSELPSGLTKEQKTLMQEKAKILYDYLDNVKRNAPVELERVTKVVKTDKEKEEEINQVEIKYYQNDLTEEKTVTLTLEPVSCTSSTDKAIETACDRDTTSKDETTLCEDINPEISESNTHGEYKKYVYYALPSGYIESMTSETGQVHRTGNTDLNASDCARQVSEAKGLCVKWDNQWVFDPLTGSVSMEEQNEKTEKGGFTLSIKGFGSCKQFSYDLSCGYRYQDEDACKDACSSIDKEKDKEKYEQCLKFNCGCLSYCGSNKFCQQMYCPTDCEKCDPDEDKIPNCDDCPKKCSEKAGGDEKSEKYLTCVYDDCCSANCTNDECRRICCETACAKKRDTLGWGESEYNLCMEQCPIIPPPDKSGIDYIYRSIDIGDPFPGRKAGQNWAGKVGYITKENDATSKYYDKTNGQTGDFEYRISLSSDDIKAIKKDNRINKTYHDFLRADTDEVVSSISDKVYCSSILHEYDLLKGKVEFGTVSLGSGCKSKR